MNARLEIARRKTLEIARNRIVAAPLVAEGTAFRLGTGGQFDNFFLWDTAFTVIWARYLADELPVASSLDSLYRVRAEDGFIGREYSPSGEPIWDPRHPIAFAPPLLTWAELSLFEITGDRERLATVYPILERHHRACRRRYQSEDGLYIGDPLGCGMDNLPRCPRGWQPDGEGIALKADYVHESLHRLLGWLASDPRFQWNEQGRWIDMSAQMAFDARLLGKLADLLGEDSDAEAFSSEHRELGRLIHERCWNESVQIYFDLAGSEQIERFHVGAYWTLIAGIVPDDCVAGLVSHLSDPDKFASLVPVATLARDDPDFEPTGRYWRGSSWPPTTYMVLAGLRHVGQGELAASIAERYVEAVLQVFEDTGTLWENLAPDARRPGEPAQADFCGWAGLGSVAIPLEFLGVPIR
jgi:hypothetical protein